MLECTSDRRMKGKEKLRIIGVQNGDFEKEMRLMNSERGGVHDKIQGPRTHTCGTPQNR